jgi:pyruvate dehydrogenase E2 component (dihydrolipoamide acetyltransferase)
MAELMRMPEVAAGATEAVLSEWLVEPGATIAVGDPVAVIETDKAQVEVEAETDGVVLRRLVEESRQVEVGSPIALLGSREELSVDPDELLSALGVDLGSTSGTPAPERRDVPDEPHPAAPVLTTPAATTGAGEQPRQFISPIARRLLREAGLEASGITGTGPGGRVVRRDVEIQIASQRASEPTEATAPEAGGDISSVSGRQAEAIEHSRLRRAIARRLTESKQAVPHFYLKRTARLDALLTLRRELNEQAGRKISVNDFVLRAVAEALTLEPEANVVWTDEAMLRFDTADIAVAVASERGLVTPVLRSVERMSLGTISSEVRELVDRANAGKLKQHELEGGTISVTNLGMFGVDEFSAIINPPHSAILAVGAATPQPVVDEGQPAVATVVTLVLSVDHRAIDGAIAARWMAALVEVLENPYRLLV